MEFTSIEGYSPVPVRSHIHERESAYIDKLAEHIIDNVGYTEIKELEFQLLRGPMFKMNAISLRYFEEYRFTLVSILSDDITNFLKLNMFPSLSLAQHAIIPYIKFLKPYEIEIRRVRSAQTLYSKTSNPITKLPVLVQLTIVGDPPID